MNKLSKINFCLVLIIMLGINNLEVISQTNKPISFGVLFYDESNEYNAILKNNLLDIQKNSNNEVQFTFYDGADNQEIQNRQLEEAINNNIDILLVNIVDINESANFVDKVKLHNIPLIFFAREPKALNALISYGKAVYVGADNCQVGKSQGDAIINQIRNNSVIDRNGNKQLDYILLKGNEDSIGTELRSRCVIEEINNNIATNEIYSQYLNWDREYTRDILTPLLLELSRGLDVIISNNDEMAIGAIEALQAFGYNSGDENRYVPVFGIGAIPAARDLINKGLMEGTVRFDPQIMADALYKIGVNLVERRNPLENSDYTLDSSGAAIRIPHGGYIVKP
jgi:methyl-galactoside transport system substrate-binding protein